MKQRLSNLLHSGTWPLVASACVVVLAGCHGAALAPKTEKPHQNWNIVRGQIKRQLAEKQLQSGLLEEAAKAATEAVALDPDTTDGYVTLARAQIELGRLELAEKTLRAAASRSLRSPELSYTHGVLLEQRNQLIEATDGFAEAHEQEPTNLDYFVAYVECLIAANRLDDARTIIDETASKWDNAPTIPVLSATVAMFADDAELATRELSRARGALTHDKYALELLGRLLLQSDIRQDSRAFLEPLMASLPADASSGSLRRTLAEAHLRWGQPAAVVDLLQAYCHQASDDWTALVLLAKAAMLTNDHLLCLSSLDRAQAAGAPLPITAIIRATTFWKRGEFAAAESELNPLLKKHPANPDIYCLLAEIARSREDMPEARAQFEIARTLAPDSLWVINGMASLDEPPVPSAE